MNIKEWRFKLRNFWETNKILISLIIVLIFVVVGIGVFFVLQKPTLPVDQSRGRCGDGVCGEKEKANPKLCLEDCSENEEIKGLNYEDEKSASGQYTRSNDITPIYVTFYSHNETDGYWKEMIEDEDLYNRYRNDLVKKINLLKDYGAVLNWETDSSVLLAMQEWEEGDELTNNKNILKWMVEDMGMVIDPHGAKESEYTYADLAYMIEEFGIESSKVTGGYLLWKCGDVSGELVQIDWKEDVGIESNGYIYGKKYPSYSWKPYVVPQAAMIGHAYDEFSSGVWKPSENDFLVSDSNEDYVSVGTGYPHTKELVGDKNSGGATIWTSGAEYVEELLSMIDSGELPAGKIYTASVHVRDDPVTSTYDDLESVLESFSGLHDAGKVVYLDYESVADIWQDEYDSEPNRVDISEFSFYDELMTEVCVGGSERRANIDKSNKCGDGICDELEKEKGVCPEDCGTTNNSESQSVNGGFCGDGTCDGPENEINCPEDCN